MFDLCLVLNNVSNKVVNILNSGMEMLHHIANTELQDPYITPFYNWYINKYPEVSKKYSKIRYIDQLKQKLTIQGLNTMKGKRLSDIFNLKKDPHNLNDPLNIKTVSNTQYAHDKLKTRLKSTQKSIIIKNERELKHIIHTKLLKQSFYEKHVAIKILEIRNQKQEFTNNLKLEQEVLLKNLQDDFIQQLYQQKHCISLINAQNKLERKRIVELEKRIHNMKLEQIHEDEFNMCYQIVQDIVDFATYFSDYKKKVTCDFSSLIWKEWTLEELNISQLINNINNIIYINEEDCQNNILPRENGDKNIFAEADMAEYLSLKGSWNLKLNSDIIVNKDSIPLGSKVLFHIVHKLLLIKYPISPPDLPVVVTASSVIGVSDERFFPELEKYLKLKQIYVIHIHLAINYCLDTYLQEEKNKQEYYLHHRKYSRDILDDAEIEKEPIGKKYSEVIDENSIGSLKNEDDEIPCLSRETQTSGFFGLEFKFSTAAELGKYAYQTLNSGKSINSHLLVDMLIQYLNSLKNINGWVFNNYPELLDDAIHLELGLSGKLKNYEPSEEIIESNEMKDDNLKRISQLSTDSESIMTSVTSKSYLTSFVHILRESQENCEENDCLNIINESVSVTDSFYNALGCSNFLTYSVFEPKLIEQVENLISTDKIFETEMYDIIVDNTFKTIEELESDRSQPEKKKNLKKKEIKVAKNKNKKSSIKTVSKDRKSVYTKKEQAIVEEGGLDSIKPGESGWIYVDMPQSQEIQKLLATMWENIETSYINSLKELFRSKRSYERTLVPYFLKIDTYFSNFIEKSNDVQKHVSVFQDEYNNVSNLCRDDDEFKAELHCRIAELKSKITELCDEKVRDTENERMRIIQENWFSNQTVSILNIYVRIVQTELNRCVQTFQLLQDYYTSMATPSLLPTKFKNATLDLIKYNDTKLYTSVATFYIDSNASTVDFTEKVLNHVLTNSLNNVKSWYALVEDNMNKLETILLAAVNSNKRKTVKLLNLSEITELLKKIGLFKQEYQCAIQGEYFRVKFRLNLINHKAVNDITELLLHGKLLFENLHARLMTKYQNELTNINSICKIFSNAVETCESVKLQVTMETIEKDDYVTDN